MNLPTQLEKYRKIIESSKRDVIKITMSYNEDLGHLDSKLGGEPYWPESMEYPMDSTHPRRPMLLLAQINCEELPEQNLLPRKGILQFFVTAIDMLDDKEQIKVVYHPNVDESNMIDDFEEIYMAVDVEDTPLYSAFGLVKLDFSLSTQYVSERDYNFKSLFGEEGYLFFKKFEDNSATQKLYYDISNVKGHAIGGYIDTYQQDIRYDECPEHEVILLQLSSEQDYITWGEDGMGHFFIKPSDLEKLDFSNVYFSCNC